MSSSVSIWEILKMIEKFRKVYPITKKSYTFIDLVNVGTPRYGAGAFIYNNKLYLVGGIVNNKVTTVIEMIDLETLEREYPQYLTEARAHFGYGFVNDKFYIIGGVGIDSVPKNDIYEYDPSSNTVTKKSATLPKGIAYCSSVVLNGKIYIIGGIDDEGNILSDTYEYDPSSDTITQKASLNVARQNLACSELNNKIYCFGGDDGSGKTDVIERYDPDTDTWETLSIKLPEALSGLKATKIVIDSKEYILLAGG